MRKSVLGPWVVAMACTLAGCGAAPEEQHETGATPIAELKQDLSLGSSGPDVRALHGYLRAFGYFPSAKLAAKYLQWTPVVPEAPADESVFDERTLEGLLALQRMSGVEPTGVVDAPTRAMLARPRCAHPESGVTGDASEKYNLRSRPLVGGIERWKSSLSYSLTTTDDGLTVAQVRQAATNALNSWGNVTNLTFSLASSGGDLQMVFSDVVDPPGGNVVAEAEFPDTAGDVHSLWLDTTDVWSVTQEFNKADVQSVVTHEAGHALGLPHSSVSGAIMGPSGNGTRNLSVDDRFAISILYDGYQQLPGAEVLSEIDVGANGDLWAIDKTPFGGGFRVLKAIQTPLTFGWTVTDGGAVKIAVEPSGIPWAITNNGLIWRRSSTDPNVPGWVPLTGTCAKDIDVGADGSLWVTGCNADAAGNNVYRLQTINTVTGASTWQLADGTLEKIAVDSTGRPWGIASNGSIWRRSSSSPTVPGWSNVGACGTDIDIQIGNATLENGNYAYTSQCGGSRIIWAYDNQNGLVDARGNFEPGVNTWWTMPPSNVVKVSSGPGNRLWYLNSAGKLFRAMK